MCRIEPILQSDSKLQKMLLFAKIILIINLLSSFLRLFLTPSDMLFDLISCLFLFLAYNSVYFIYMAFYLIFSLINSVSLFIKSATVFQMIIQDTLGDFRSKVAVYLGVSLYLLVFYIAAIFFTYPTYKEMKAQLFESLGGGSGLNSRILNRNSQVDQERPQQPSSQDSNNIGRGFQAFSGRGVQVGGG
jgi:hypothetical protein